MKPIAGRLLFAGIFVASLVLLSLIGQDTGYTATSPQTFNYEPTTSTKMCNDLPVAGAGGGIETTVIPAGQDGACTPNVTPGANADWYSTFDIPQNDQNFGFLMFYTPDAATIAPGPGNPSFNASTDPNLGVPIGTLRSNTTLGLINGPCNTNVIVTFLFLNSDVNTANIIPDDGSISGYPNGPMLPEGTAKRFAYLNDPDPEDGSTITGTADSGTSNTLTDTGAFGAAHSKIGMTVMITGGTGAGQRALVTENTSDTLSVNRVYDLDDTNPALPTISGSFNTNWLTTPNGTSQYRLGIPFLSTRTPDFVQATFDADRVSPGDWDGDTIPDTVPAEAAQITPNFLQPLARYAGWTIPPSTGEPTILEFVEYSAGVLDGFSALTPDNDTHPFSRANATSFGDPYFVLLNNPISVKSSPSSISDFCTTLGTKTLLLGQDKDGHNRWTNPSANSGIGGTGWHNFMQYSMSTRDSSGNGAGSSGSTEIDTCGNRFVPKSEATDFPGGARPSADPASGDYGWSPTWTSSVSTWNAPDAINGTSRTYQFAQQPFDVDGDGIPNSCDPDPLTADVNEDNPADPTIEYLNRQDNCPTVDNPGNEESENFTAYNVAAPDGGPRTDSVGDACDGGTQTTETGKVSSATTTVLTVLSSGTSGDARKWPQNIFRGATLRMTSGAQNGQSRPIGFNNANQIALDTALPGAPGAGDTFVIERAYSDTVADGFFTFSTTLTSVCFSSSPVSECTGYPTCTTCGDVDGDLYKESVEKANNHDPLARCGITTKHSAWPPDIDGNGSVNVLDLSTVGGKPFGLSAGTLYYWESADVDGNGSVNVLDLSTVGGAAFGTSCTVGPG
jgi:hypothetical protein